MPSRAKKTLPPVSVIEALLVLTRKVRKDSSRSLGRRAYSAGVHDAYNMFVLLCIRSCMLQQFSGTGLALYTVPFYHVYYSSRVTCS